MNLYRPTTSSTSSTILVTGATGTVGSGVVDHLRGTNAHVRAFVRDTGRASARLGDDVELVVGDLADPDSVRTALRGVDAVFLACGNVPDQILYEKTVIDLAREAGVRRIVKLSARGADHRASNSYWRAHAEIEDHLRASGVPSVVLRPSFLMSNLFAAVDHIRHSDSLLAPAGAARIAMIDPVDVAAVAALALSDPTVAPGVLTLTGPESLGYEQVARELSALVGRPLAYVDVPPEAMVAGLVQAGVPESAATEVVQVFGALRAGDQATITDTVARLTGRAGSALADFAARHAGVFGVATHEARTSPTGALPAQPPAARTSRPDVVRSRP